ncbi:unnamed protein product [Linum trigynum]|uniref:Uncharacterized protein n=1 Tax=Linum trigynum TaxID=586398 RepID=A0AAV2FGP4_9ROSI
MGQSLTLASPSFTPTDASPSPSAMDQLSQVLTNQTQNQSPMPISTTAATEEVVTRPEKKRKPEERTIQSTPIDQQTLPTNLSFDSLSFVQVRIEESIKGGNIASGRRVRRKSRRKDASPEKGSQPLRGQRRQASSRLSKNETPELEL